MSNKIVAIHQPNFLPWIGYFHKIANVDKFVYFDNVQLPGGKSFCYRTKILFNNGKDKWLSIPLLGKSDKSLIMDTKIDIKQNWKYKHLRTLSWNYKTHPFFDEIYEIIESVYKIESQFLIDYNIPLITKISEYLELDTEFICSSKISNDSNLKGLDRIIEINEFCGAKEYLSGNGAGSKRYMDERYFTEKDIVLKWQEFEFRKYPQLNSQEFIPGLSIIDLLFNCGPQSKNIIQGK